MATAFQNLAPRIMRDLMRDVGFTVEDAAAALGNMGHESGGLTAMQEKRPVVAGSRGGYGWCQWTGPRRRAFEAWCGAKGVSVDSYEGNYGYLLHELQASEKATVPATKKAVGLEAKVKAFEANFERAGVKHYASRLKWAQQAFDLYQAAPAQTPGKITRLDPKTGAPIAAATAPASRAWYSRLLSGIGILPTPAVAAPVVPPEGPPTTVVRRVQEQLQALGYSEVGIADGIMGPNTRKAILAFSAEQAPPLDVDGEITDEVLAALAKAHPRPVSEERATTTAKDLRQAGNEPARGLHQLGWLGTALLGGGGLGGLDQTGILDSLKNTSDNVGSAFSSIGSVVTSLAGAVQWCMHHWWIFAVLGGLWTVYRVARAVLELVALFRNNVLTRAKA